MKSDTSLAYLFMWISTGAPASVAASRTERTTGFIDAGGKYADVFAQVYEASGLRGRLTCFTNFRRMISISSGERKMQWGEMKGVSSRPWASRYSKGREP